MNLQSAINNRSAKIGVIGLGYVGLPVATAFAEAGFTVFGIDVNDSIVNALNQGKSHVGDISDETVKTLIDSGRFAAGSDYAHITNLDAVIICVPTPLNKVKDPDVSFIISVTEKMVPHIHKDLLVVLESTTYPGTTRELVMETLEQSGLKVGKEIYLCYSPERIDPGNETYTLKNTPKVVGGVTETCTRLGTELYSQIATEVVPVSSPEAAEMVKLLENTFRSINIGLANEIALMCEKLGIDMWEVTDAAATKPFGFMKFTPGPGLGGHCIPIDPQYLAWKMRSLDYRAKFIELAQDINTHMPHHVVELVSDGLNHQGHALKNSRILLCGIAYKRDIDDVRESPALDVLKLLEEDGAEVEFYDTNVEGIRWNGGTKKGLPELNQDAIQSFKAVVILADHSDVDYTLIRKNANLIVDTRNVYPDADDDNIIRLGVGKKN